MSSTVRSLILAPTLSMNPEVKELIVPLVAIKSTVVERLLLIVVTEILLAEIVSAIMLLVLIFTGEKVVVVKIDYGLAFVALRFSNEPLVALTVVVVYDKCIIWRTSSD